MKITLMVLSLFIFLQQISSQSITAESISSAGGSYTGPSSAISFTTGEIMSATYTAGGNKLTEGFQQQYYTCWTGKVNTSWNNLANWKGGPVPGRHTDVLILSGCPFYPAININATCRSLKLRSFSSVTVSAGFNLTITH